jgi:hypothetical protein
VLKAKALHVTRGRVYGYSNVDVLGEPDKDGRPRRLYVERKINVEQAEVVRKIFELYVDGLGLKRIAKQLNADRTAPPRKDAHGWAPTAIREMLHRDKVTPIRRRPSASTRSGSRRRAWVDVLDRPAGFGSNLEPKCGTKRESASSPLPSTGGVVRHRLGFSATGPRHSFSSFWPVLRVHRESSPTEQGR